jgi:hypothetical protein
MHFAAVFLLIQAFHRLILFAKARMICQLVQKCRVNPIAESCLVTKAIPPPKPIVGIVGDDFASRHANLSAALVRPVHRRIFRAHNQLANNRPERFRAHHQPREPEKPRESQTLAQKGKPLDRQFSLAGAEVNQPMQCKALDPEWPGSIAYSVPVAPLRIILRRHHGPMKGGGLRAKVLDILGGSYQP